MIVARCITEKCEWSLGETVQHEPDTVYLLALNHAKSFEPLHDIQIANES